MLAIFCYIFYAILAYKWYRWFTCKPSFKGKTVFITGGSSGIGEALTKRLSLLGVKRIIIASRKLEEMQRVKKESPVPALIHCLQMDLADPEKCLKIVQEFCEKDPIGKEGIDILINNAGLTMREEFDKTDFDTCKYMMNVNCMSHIAITKAFLPILTSKKDTQIVNVISIAGMIGTGFRTMYCAAKFGTAGFFKALRPEVK